MQNSIVNPFSRFWHSRWAVVSLLIIGMTVRFLFGWLPRMPRWDEASYLMIGRNLLAGNGYRELVGGFDVHQPPMVAFLSVVGLALKLPLNWAAALPAHVLLGSLVVLPLYALGTAIYGRRTGLLAACLGAFYPVLAVNSLYWGSMTEPVFMLEVLTGLYTTYRTGVSLSRGKVPWGWALLTGLALGLGYLTRPESLVFALVLLAYLMLLALRRWRVRLIPALLAGVVIVATIAVVAAPYVRYLHQVTGYWTLSGKAGTGMDISWALVNDSQPMHDQAAAALDSSGEEIMWLSHEGLTVSVSDWIKADPQRFLTLIRRNLRATVDVLFSKDLFNLGLAALTCLGLFSHAWQRRQWRGQLLLLLALTPIASLWIVFIENRLLAVYIAISLVWAGAGLAQLTHWAADTLPRWRTLAATLPVTLVVAWMLWQGINVANEQIPTQPFYRLEAADWLAENTPPGAPVMTRNAETPLYANRPMVGFPRADWPQVLRYAQKHGARYLVVDEWEATAVRPQLSWLLAFQPGQARNGITELTRIPHPGRDILIFEFDAERASLAK